MKIITIVKQVPDADSPIRATNGSLDASDANWFPDGMDEYGVEQAVRIKDERDGVEVVVLALGPEQGVLSASVRDLWRAVPVGCWVGGVAHGRIRRWTGRAYWTGQGFAGAEARSARFAEVARGACTTWGSDSRAVVGAGG